MQLNECQYLDPFDSLLGILLFVCQVGDEHICALTCKCNSYSPADAAVAASDHCALASQTACSGYATNSVASELTRASMLNAEQDAQTEVVDLLHLMRMFQQQRKQSFTCAFVALLSVIRSLFHVLGGAWWGLALRLARRAAARVAASWILSGRHDVM